MLCQIDQFFLFHKIIIQDQVARKLHQAFRTDSFVSVTADDLQCHRIHAFLDQDLTQQHFVHACKCHQIHLFQIGIQRIISCMCRVIFQDLSAYRMAIRLLEFRHLYDVLITAQRFQGDRFFAVILAYCQ